MPGGTLRGRDFAADSLPPRDQREQIAILKAFGFANRQIVAHYLKFALVMVVAGTAIGGSFAAPDEERKKRGWPPLEIEGWEVAPRYNAESHNLEWAVKARSPSGTVPRSSPMTMQRLRHDSSAISRSRSCNG